MDPDFLQTVQRWDGFTLFVRHFDVEWEEAIRQVRFLQNPFFPKARTNEVLDCDVDLFTAMFKFV